MYNTGLLTKCSIACLKVKCVPCAKAPCPGVGSSGELAYTISVLDEYVLSSEISLFLHLPLFFFLSMPCFPALSFDTSLWFLSFLIASPSHPLQIIPLKNGRHTKKIVLNLSL